MWGFFEYVPVAQKKANAQKALNKLKKKNPDIEPVIIEGRKIANTWWAVAWNKNLESYADYSNRISRGRSYLKNGFVLDLKVSAGLVTALVQGSGKDPYVIRIEISPLSKKNWENIIAGFSHQIDNLAELAEGNFPKELANLFTLKEKGLFPQPKEIKFNCSCPDWASMCKHVAAVLYGIGAKFDQDPVLFFKLRDIDFEVLLKKSVEEKMRSMLQNSGRKTKRVLDEADANIKELFGV